MMKKAVLAICFILTVSPAWANFFDGNKLHQLCNDETLFSLGVCRGYITGIVDAFDRLAGLPPDKTFCTPENSSTGQLIAVVKAWLEKNPQFRHFSAKSLISTALHEAFPCK
jgi:hypothetical protein